MSEPDEPPIEHELLRDATLAEIEVVETEINPTSADDKHVRIEGRLGLEEDEDGEPVNDAEHYAFGFIYALGVLSFADARPRGVSGMHFEEKDDWAVGDMLRRLRFERGELRFYADYVRGRCRRARRAWRAPEPKRAGVARVRGGREASRRWIRVGAALVMCAHAGKDGAVVAAKEPRDFGVAVASLGVVADGPPELVSGEVDAASAGAAAELVHEHAAAQTDRVEQRDELVVAKRGEHADGELGGGLLEAALLGGDRHGQRFRVPEPTATFFGAGCENASR
jgi:hypothetical protein